VGIVSAVRDFNVDGPLGFKPLQGDLSLAVPHQGIPCGLNH